MARKQIDFLLTSFLDTSGNQLAGGLIRCFAAGTSTEEALYTAISGGSAATQPVALDSYGIKQLYVDGGTNIKITIKTADDVTTLYTFDNLEVKALTGVLPLSAGSSFALTDDLYGGGNDLRNFVTGTFGLNIDGDGTLHAITASAGTVTAHADADEIVAEDSGNGGVSVLSTGKGSLFFGDAADNDVGYVQYDHSNNSMVLGANAGTVLTITSSAVTSGVGVAVTGNSSITGSVGITGVLTVTESEPTGEAISANATLVIKDSGTNYLQFAADSSATSIQGILFGDDDEDNGYISYTHGASPVMVFGVAAAERMRITSTGLVGIGTTPSAKLHVLEGTASEGPVHTSSILILESDGVGATSESIVQFRSNTATSQGFVFGDSADADPGSIVYNHSDNGLRFVTNASERMIISGSGLVGIGATSPVKTLHILEGSASQGLLHDGSIALFESNGVGATGECYLQFTTAAASQIQGLLFGDDSASSAGYIHYSHATDLLTLATNNTGRLYIVGTGATANIGINTTSYGASSVGVIGIANATTIPTGNPTDGGVIFCEAGALKYRGSSGTVTTLGAA